MNRTTLVKNFPELTAQLIERNREYKKVKQENDLQTALKFGRRLIDEMKEADIPLTERNIKKVYKLGLWQSDPLRYAISQLLGELKQP